MSIFTKTPVKGIPSNSFDLQHDVKLSLDAGWLVPIVCTEVLPGDSINYQSVLMARLAPMISPVMHKMNITTFKFFVPMRLLWENSEEFFSNPIPDDNTPVAPYFSSLNVGVGELGDYLGLPTRKVYDSSGGTRDQYTFLSKVSALPFAVYQKIWSDYFRDENLQKGSTDIFEPLTDGDNTTDWSKYNALRRRAWQHDYFTSSLPFAQKGDPVSLPIGGFSDVAVFKADYTIGESAWKDLNAEDVKVPNRTDGSPGQSPKKLYADTSSLTPQAVTINDLRWAYRLQEFLEKNARGGTRYIELMKQHFGVRSSDARLQRSEFLGSSTQPIIISEVLQTSSTGAETTPLAEMAGHGISTGAGKKTRYTSEEHGFFMVLVNIRPMTSYSQGLPKMWSRFSPLDYAFPTFAHLGEQAVLAQEVYYNDTDGQNGNTFGYIPRYAEYRYENSRVAGEFRTSLAHWHMSRIFANRPLLNETFIKCDPTERIFAVESPGTHSYYVHVNNLLSMRRKLPRYGVPAT